MKPGFNIGDVLNVLGFNLISRSLSIIIKLITILYGLLFVPVGFILGFFLAISWGLLPLFTFPFFRSRIQTNHEKALKLLQKVRKQGGDMRVLLMAFLNDDEGKFISQRLGFDLKKITKQVKDIKESSRYSLFEDKIKLGEKTLNLSDLFITSTSTYPVIKDIFEKNNIKCDDIYQTALWFEKLQEKQDPPVLFSFSKIRALPGIGIDWSYGYTVQMDRFASELTKKPSPFPFLVGREKEITGIERVLVKTEANNVLLIGDPGVGRHILLETLAHRIAVGYAPHSLSHKRIIMLNMHALASEKPSVLEIKGLASAIFEEAENAGNVIIVIDEIDKYVSTGVGRLDLSDVLLKFAQSSIGFIAITEPDLYHKFIEQNSNLAKLFTNINLSPPSQEVLLLELELSIVPVLERKYKVLFGLPAIYKAVEDAQRFISTTPFPGKAIELLDGVAVFTASEKKSNLITPEFVEEFLTNKLHIPIGKLKGEEKEKLIHLEDLLHKRVINQEPAIRILASSMRRSRLDITSSKKPIGSFLFLGPTGVGKTETAKALAEIYYGSEDLMLRFDMSQYQHEEGITRLIGSIKLGIPGELTSKIRQQPFSLVLLDEFEKADPEIYNLFLTLFDEGYISDAFGKKADGKNAIFIATSNAGAEFLREKINQGVADEQLQKELIEYVQTERIFSPELLNRFDGVVVFTPLSEGHLREVAKIMLAQLDNKLKKQEIQVAVTTELIKKLANIGFDPQWGARAIKRVISERIEDQVAKRLLEGNVKKGEMIEIEI